MTRPLPRLCFPLLLLVGLALSACSEVPTTSCTPQCAGVECGLDGCGGSCGECFGGAICIQGFCGECQPDCFGKVCGPDDCGGSCGECPGNSICGIGGCGSCTGNCVGRECGDDGCGGSCGECLPEENCTLGLCTDCVPSCEGVNCGDDGCGGSCGDCGLGLACVAGACTACTSECAGLECGDDGCNGVCGFCDAGFLCDAGTCAQCTPQCTGLDCGPDGCGLVCGECPPGVACTEGVCSGCAPSCLGKECFASDGCGDTCWNCPLEDTTTTATRAAFAAGMSQGQSLYSTSLSGVLTGEGISGGEYLAGLSSEVEAFSGLVQPIEPCPFVQNLTALVDEPPKTCDFLAAFSLTKAYSGVTQHLAAHPLPEDLQAVDATGDLEFQYKQGINFGIERYRVLLMWDMKAKGICDTPLSPVTATHEKGLVIGMQATANAFNNWLTVQDLVPDLPGWENSLQLCAPQDGINASWIIDAEALLGLALSAEAPCNVDYSPPDEVTAAAWEEAKTLYMEGLELGLSQEVTLINARLRALVPCGVLSP